MLSSDKLIRQKQDREQSSRIDELSKSVQILRRDINEIKSAIRQQNQDTTKQLRELYSFTKKLESAYLNGLSTNNNIMDYDTLEQNVTNDKSIFDIHKPFSYDA